MEPCPIQLEANKLAHVMQQSILGLSKLPPYLVQVAPLLEQLLRPSHPKWDSPSR